MKCKNCKKTVHYCSSCGFVGYYMDEGFCSDKCWKESEEYTKALKDFDIFIYEFDDKQIEFLFDLVDGEYTNYEIEFIYIIKKRLETTSNL